MEIGNLSESRKTEIDQSSGYCRGRSGGRTKWVKGANCTVTDKTKLLELSTLPCIQKSKYNVEHMKHI